MSITVENYRLFIIYHLKSLKALDGTSVVSVCVHLNVYNFVNSETFLWQKGRIFTCSFYLTVVATSRRVEKNMHCSSNPIT